MASCVNTPERGVIQYWVCEMQNDKVQVGGLTASPVGDRYEVWHKENLFPKDILHIPQEQHILERK